MPEIQHAPPGRCTACCLPPSACLCPGVAPISLGVDLLLLRHWKEAFSTTNTARLAKLAVPGARLHDYGAPPPHAPLPSLERELAAPGTWLLYPGGQETPPEGLRCLIVVDGSWRQASKMVQRVPGLKELPRYSPRPLAAKRPRVRMQHSPEGMATLEAVARAVAGLEGEEKAAPLEALFSLYVQRVQALRAYPARTR